MTTMDSCAAVSPAPEIESSPESPIYRVNDLTDTMLSIYLTQWRSYSLDS